MKTTFGYQQALTLVHQVTQQLFGISLVDTGPYRHADFKVIAAGTGAIALATLDTGLGTVARLKAEIDQGVQAAVCHQPNAAAIAAIPAIGTSALDEFFTVKAHAAITASAGFNHNFCFIYEFHGLLSV
jgi:hypothetical protein